jgi:hypothetical protein
MIGGDSTAQRPHLDAAGSMLFQTSTQDVRTVLVAGRTVKRDGVMTGVDLPKLLSEAETSAGSVLSRISAPLPCTPPGGFAVIGDMVVANLAS